MKQSAIKIFPGQPEEWNHWLDEISGASAYQYHPFIKAGDRRFQVFSGELAVAGGVLLSAPLLAWPRRILAVHRGPIGDLMTAIDVFATLARSEGAWCLEVMPDVTLDDALKAELSAQDWRPVGAERHTLRLDLSPDEGTLLADLESRGRYRVKRAEREGITVRPAQNNLDVDAFCRLHAEMCAEKQLDHASDDHLSRLGNYLLAHPSRGVVLLAEHKGEVLGSNLLWRSAQRVEYLFGASRKQKVAVGYPLQWASIKWAKAAGAKEYDFGGYDPKLNGGPAQMKRAFCRNVVTLSPRWRKLFHPTLFNVAQRLRGWMKG